MIDSNLAGCRSPVAGLLFFGAALAGCARPASDPCARALPACLEVRDGAGALELAVKERTQAGARQLCDGAGQKLGQLVEGSGALTLLDRAGRLVLRLRSEATGDLTGDGPTGARLWVHRDRTELRVLRPDGVPFGSIAQEDGRATVFDRAGRGLGTVEPRGRDQRLLGADGSTRGYVSPAAIAGLAGLFALDGLSLSERAALYFAQLAQTR